MLCVDYLFEHPEHLECVAEWIHAEFSADKRPLASVAGFAVTSSNCADRIPLSLLALADDVPVGTINLVENDDENRTYLRPWLAALFVVPDRRRQGIGRARPTPEGAGSQSWNSHRLPGHRQSWLLREVQGNY